MPASTETLAGETNLARPPVTLMGLDFAALSEAETVQRVLEELGEGRGGWVCPVNLDVLRKWHESEEVRGLLSHADLVVADGMPLLWASALQGTPLPERVAGSTMTVALTQAAARTGASIFFLGGNPGTAQLAADKLKHLSPELRVAGTLCPPFGFEHDDEWIARIESTLRSARPDLVYVGLGFPKQDRLIVSLREVLPDAWFMSCGISFSFIAGEIRRAPRIVQRLGFEWLHRLAQEPRRLGSRYLVHGPPFLLALLCSSLVVRSRDSLRQWS